MPTGYTAGILNGKIKTFPQFAEQCMRAFMPCIHMKEESFDAKYKPRKPNSFYVSGLREAKEKLKNAKNITDKKIVEEEKKYLNTNIIYYKNEIKKRIKNRENLQRILDKVSNWTPPTSEHERFRTFMMEQIGKTIDMDCDVDFCVHELEKEKTKLKNVNASEIRKKKIQSYTEDISNYKKYLDDDIKNCESSNKWVKDLLKSLK